MTVRWGGRICNSRQPDLPSFSEMRTIGYGHTGPDVRVGETITQFQAAQLLIHDLAAAEECVNKHVTVSLTQGQYDALVDFTFNAGRGSLLHSTLLEDLNRHDYTGAAEQFGLWVHAGGTVVPGLVRRREAERDLFLSDTP